VDIIYVVAQRKFKFGTVFIVFGTQNFLSTTRLHGTVLN